MYDNVHKGTIRRFNKTAKAGSAICEWSCCLSAVFLCLNSAIRCMVLLKEPIKAIGSYNVPIRVYKEVEPEITVQIVPE